MSLEASVRLRCIWCECLVGKPRLVIACRVCGRGQDRCKEDVPELEIPRQKEQERGRKRKRLSGHGEHIRTVQVLGLDAVAPVISHGDDGRDDQLQPDLFQLQLHRSEILLAVLGDHGRGVELATTVGKYHLEGQVRCVHLRSNFPGRVGDAGDVAAGIRADGAVVQDGADHVAETLAVVMKTRSAESLVLFRVDDALNGV
jgi:hypothetical protein